MFLFIVYFVYLLRRFDCHFNSHHQSSKRLNKLATKFSKKVKSIKSCHGYIVIYKEIKYAEKCAKVPEVRIVNRMSVSNLPTG